MEKMSFKTFIWPQNPHTYREEFLREPMYGKNELEETVFLGMGPVKRTVTGEGAFFGNAAYESFRQLSALFAEESVGLLNHPLWGERTVWFTGLELTQEPKENWVSYRFTFREASADGEIPR